RCPTAASPTTSRSTRTRCTRSGWSSGSSAEQVVAHGVDHDAGEATDHRAVDADELEVAADLQLDATAGVVGVPLLDGGGDQVGHLVAVLLDQVVDGPFDPAVDLGPQLGIGLDGVAEPDDAIDHAAPQLGLGVGG